jgi:general secretion pathway protein D
VILAKGTEYRQILAALRQLDVSPLQVLVEVTIAEVALTDNLEFGVEWFFNNSVGGGRTGFGTLDLGTAGLNSVVPGFSYLIQNSGGTTKAVLNTLATESNLSVISSPSLLVLNNEEASIQVGDEVPVTTQQQQSTDADANIINSIEYRETGVLLTVKPRINAGGLVIMEVEQEFSQVPSTNNADPLTPRISQRKVSSTVAVNSGDTIILGGLITEDRDLSESGVPVLHKIPGLGALFGTKADNQARTELIVLITPTAIGNSTAALQVTESFRRRLQKLIPSRTETAAADAPETAQVVQ